jgi:hypothetical protein
MLTLDSKTKGMGWYFIKMGVDKSVDNHIFGNHFLGCVGL